MIKKTFLTAFALAQLSAIGTIVAMEKAPQPPLITFARHGNLEMLQTLIQEGADVNESDSSGMTALMAAASQGHRNCCQFLRQSGANVNAQDKEGKSVLMYAANYAYFSICWADHPKSTEERQWIYDWLIKKCGANTWKLDKYGNYASSYLNRTRRPSAIGLY